MLRSLWTAATGMDAQQSRMDIISNNLANVSTTGFKKVRAEFEDLLSDTIRSVTPPDGRGGSQPAPLQVGLGARLVATTPNLSQGEVTATNNPLDLAIQGQGFFQVQRANGELAYTRAGNFTLDATGRIVTPHGEMLQPGITIPTTTTAITIKADGTVWATSGTNPNPQEVGSLQLYNFPNPGGLESTGDNLFNETVASGNPLSAKPGEQGTGTLLQGYLENSNVTAITEMIDMIDCQRAYELNSKVIQTADQMLQKVTTIR